MIAFKLVFGVLVSFVSGAISGYWIRDRKRQQAKIDAKHASEGTLRVGAESSEPAARAIIQAQPEIKIPTVGRTALPMIQMTPEDFEPTVSRQIYNFSTGKYVKP